MNNENNKELNNINYIQREIYPYNKERGGYYNNKNNDSLYNNISKSTNYKSPLYVSSSFLMRPPKIKRFQNENLVVYRVSPFHCQYRYRFPDDNNDINYNYNIDNNIEGQSYNVEKEKRINKNLNGQYNNKYSQYNEEIINNTNNYNKNNYNRNIEYKKPNNNFFRNNNNHRYINNSEKDISKSQQIENIRKRKYINDNNGETINNNYNINDIQNSNEENNTERYNNNKNNNIANFNDNNNNKVLINKYYNNRPVMRRYNSELNFTNNRYIERNLYEDNIKYYKRNPSDFYRRYEIINSPNYYDPEKNYYNNSRYGNHTNNYYFNASMRNDINDNYRFSPIEKIKPKNYGNYQ